MQKITYYLRGNVSETEALALWVYLISHPEDLQLLETYAVLNDLFNNKNATART